MAEILPRLTEIFQEVFEDDELTVTRATTPKDIEDWDSLRHVSLVVAVESAFGIRFSSSEIAGLKSVGDFADTLERRQ